MSKKLNKLNNKKKLIFVILFKVLKKVLSN